MSLQEASHAHIEVACAGFHLGACLGDVADTVHVREEAHQREAVALFRRGLKLRARHAVAVVLLPLRDAVAVPLLGYRRVEVLHDVDEDGVFQRGAGLLLPLRRHCRRALGEHQRLALPLCAVEVQGFRPQLVTVALYGGHGVAVLAQFGVDGDGVEAAVAVLAAQEMRLVGRSAEHALPLVVYLVVSVSRPELVLLHGDELLDCLLLRLVHGGEFGEFDYPRAAQRVARVLGAHVGQRVGEPLAAHDAEQRRLAAPLLAVEREDVVILDARLVDACHRRHEVQFGHFSVGLVVLRADVAGDEFRKSRRAVPGEALEVVFDWVVAVLLRRPCECCAHVLFVCYVVFFVYVQCEVVCVVVAERRFAVAGFQRVAVRPVEPRRGAVQLDALRELVVLEFPPQGVVLLQYDVEVQRLVERRAVLAALELRRYAVGVVLFGLRVCFRVWRQRGDTAAQPQHGEVRGHGGQRRARLCLRVVAAVAVQPDEVEGVQQPSVCGVGGMIGVCPLAVVDDHAVGGGRADVSPAAALSAPVHVGEELLDSLADRVVQAAEVADRAVLLQGVACLAGE